MTGNAKRAEIEAVGITGDEVMPRHIAIIMDGNGRWATARGLTRTHGHRKGVDALRKAVRHAADIGIDYLTLFSFSSENWTRPPDEVRELIGLLKLFLRNDLAKLRADNVRVMVIGERTDLQRDIRDLLDEAEATTILNTGMRLVIAFNYGGRDEIGRAVRRIADAVKAGRLSPEDVDTAMISTHLDTAGIPDPDLIIRTSGEQRLSNFLLWQAAYAEFVFLPVYWPDFATEDFDLAIAEFRNRDRRYGGIAARRSR